ncbi:PAS domain-containing protein [Ferrovibrio terrae]|uniref:PAS domain-containing protein n=1 Tax=Ferrovibrio terrae TaxID=2594003 RepID=A0A516H0M7_9PROT|nr:PAS domain-containing protein [Ferrovibrio terrae]QDO97331.1 PAS domain-containing protein [Ferrovibrio terrae]
MVGQAGNAGAAEGAVAEPGVWPVFRDPRFLTLLRHWASNRVGLMMPRAVLDPVDIKACLAHIWLAQYLPGEDSFVFRLAGERVNEAWGANITGKRSEEFMPAASAVTATQIYRRILLTPAVHVGYRRIEPAERQEKGAERLVVPLSDADGGPWGIVGMSLYHFNPVTEADLPPYVGPDVTYYPCAGLPSGSP